jgi:single-strand DNA-binding protein
MSNNFSGVCTVGRDAEVRYLPSGQAVLTVNLANNVGFGDKQQTNWIRGILWGKRAEGSLKDYLKKGQQVFISGELTTSEYEKKDGTKGFQVEVNANTIDLIGRKNDSQQYAPAQQVGYAQPQPQQTYQSPRQQYQGIQQQAAQTQHYAPTQNNYQQQPPTAMSYINQPVTPDDDIPF